MRCILILLLLVCSQAQAGPWPRGKGKVFFSVHMNGEYFEESGLVRQYGSLYAEYGLTDRITLGLDYNGSEITTDKAIAFARIPLGNPDRALKMSAEIGAGLVEGETVFRPAFSIGRGFSWRNRNGWITLDTRAVLGGSSIGTRIESDFTFGLGVTDRTRVILQLQGGMPSKGDNYLKFAPSVVFEMKQRKAGKWRLFGRKSPDRREPRKGRQFIELGLTTGLVNYEDYGAKIGIWREF